MTTDLFLVTYPGDYQWLPYLFRSIARNVVGFRHFVIVVEEDFELPYVVVPESAGVRLNAYFHRCQRYEGTSYPGQWGQQIEKLRAWKYTDADRIVFIDSDAIFARPTDLQTDPNISIELPFVVHCPWHLVSDHVIEHQGKLCSASPRKWYQPTRELLGFVPFAETMRLPPYVMPSWVLRHLWEHIGGEERIRALGCPPVEFNLMGNFAWACHPDAFTFVEIPGPAIPQTPVVQFWSKTEGGPAHPSIQAQLTQWGLDK